MSKWKSFISGTKKSKPKKSLTELKDEVEKLKKAKSNVESYEKLQAEKKKIQTEIRQEGFKMRHKKALGIINKGIDIGKNISKKL